MSTIEPDSFTGEAPELPKPVVHKITRECSIDIEAWLREHAAQLKLDAKRAHDMGHATLSERLESESVHCEEAERLLMSNRMVQESRA